MKISTPWVQAAALADDLFLYLLVSLRVPLSVLFRTVPGILFLAKAASDAASVCPKTPGEK